MNKIKDTIEILKSLGLPRAQQNERSALTLLALVDLKEKTPWNQARKRIIRIHDILSYISENYGKKYAENTRETIRRQTLHQFEQAGLVERNPDNPRRPTNSPRTVYSINDIALKVIQSYDSDKWFITQKNFIKIKGKLVDRYAKRKKNGLIVLNLPNKSILEFSPGKHNELQVKVIQELQPRFCPNSKVLYIGDTARKMLFKNDKLLQKIGISITRHDKLPDVVLYDEDKNCLFLIEAVTAHGPFSPKRQIELENVLVNCKAKRIYISAFPDMREFKKHINNIAWESEVWIQDNPDHMIHFNGPKFFTVYK